MENRESSFELTLVPENERVEIASDMRLSPESEEAILFTELVKGWMLSNGSDFEHVQNIAPEDIIGWFNSGAVHATLYCDMLSELVCLES